VPGGCNVVSGLRHSVTMDSLAAWLNATMTSAWTGISEGWRPGQVQVQDSRSAVSSEALSAHLPEPLAALRSARNLSR